MMKRLCACFCCLVMLLSVTRAGPLLPKDVPVDLKPWIDWALWGNEQRVCPFAYDDAGQRLCAWPSRLDLNLQPDKGDFRTQWAVQADAWIPLPGDGALWPQDVFVDGKPARVMAKNQMPVVLVPPGNHDIRGRLFWDRLPETLSVPRNSGLIALTVNGQAISAPAFNEQGQLWLEGAGQGRQDRAEIANRLELQVFRQIVDDIPFQLITHIELDVAGERREVLLTGALPKDFIALSLESSLPARLEPDGRLRVQLRPGRGQITVTARHSTSLARLSLPPLPEPWPSSETWVFQARPQLRVVELEGLTAVDPNQTNLPQAWRNLPAYHFAPGDTLNFRLIQRGDPQPEPDALTLARNLWLDFDGGGYTISDLITGTMTHDWRLNVLGATQLGRVAVDGVPQLITRLGGQGPVGVEVRRGSLNLTADSRLERQLSTFPATGWDKDFRSVRAQLHLPPGWRLFAVSGVDNATDSWVSRWTLLDLFLMLVASLAVARLWSWRQGALALLALTLLWHEPGAPRLVWLNLLAAIALLRVLPGGRLQLLAKTYKAVSLLALIFIGLPFMVEQIRTGIYPQLEMPWFTPASPEAVLSGGTAEVAQLEAMSSDEAYAPTEAAPAARPALRKRAAGLSDYTSDYASQHFAEIDPGAITQTGPGLPQWRWKTTTLAWNATVTQEHELALWLISPRVGMLLNFLRAALLLGLAYVLLRGTLPQGGTPWRPSTSPVTTPAKSSVAGSVLLALLLSVGHTPEVKAELPSQTLLNELKNRLLAPPECLPECAQIAHMRLKLDGDTLRQELEIHAQQHVAVPLPALEGQWLPTEVIVDGTPAQAVRRSDEGGLWLSLEPGRHQVTLSGPLPQRDQVQIPLPLKPRRVESTSATWTVTGLGDNGVPDAQLQLSRIATAADDVSKPLEPLALPAFLEIRRTLQFGLDWRVATQVRRLSPADAPIVVEVPLLEGESVLSEGLPVRNGKASVGMVTGQSELQWTSLLEKRPEVVLTAPETNLWVEAWRIDVSPIWHVQSRGIAVAHHQDSNGNWLPEWRPWPGETVSLSLTRPEGVPGPSLTIDSSRLEISPRHRAVDGSLSLTVRSSQGGQHVVKVPDGATLLSILVDGQSRPIRQQERLVTLPIHPGQQTFTLNWSESKSIAGIFSVPAIDLGEPSVNSFITVKLAEDRWVLLAGGPLLGPAVLFWGVLAVIVIVALALGRLPLTPIKSWQWALLLVGLSQIPLPGAVCVTGWLLLLGWRQQAGGRLDNSRFNVLQLGLAVLTVAALLILFYAVEHGLLGLPDMQVAGNNSNGYTLNWYQDHSAASLPRPWVLTAPMWTYRVTMLAWALWLAYSLLQWLHWGWNCYATGGLWRPRKKQEKQPNASEEANL